MNESFKERRKILRSNFKEIKGKFMFAKSQDTSITSNVEELEKFLDKSIKQRCEGLILKKIDSTYEISKRSFNWLKLKKDYLQSGLGDSLDLCVVGADHG